MYRHFGSKDKTQIARALRVATRRNGCKLLIGNDPKLALKAGADGIHWAESRISDSKYWKNQFSIMIGAAHSRAALQQCSQAGLDGVLLSTVFPSASPSASKPMGSLKYRELAKSCDLPVYALGGITADNALSISGWGGIAAISGIEQAFGPRT